MKEVLSDNGITKVVKDGGWVFKYMPKFMCDNECHALRAMFDVAAEFGRSIYVPQFERCDLEVVKVRFVERTEITDIPGFLAHIPLVLKSMRDAAIRHGDLTSHSIIPNHNTPILIDWSESRHLHDPRPDKRREGDSMWLLRAMEELCNAS